MALNLPLHCHNLCSFKERKGVITDRCLFFELKMFRTESGFIIMSKNDFSPGIEDLSFLHHLKGISFIQQSVRRVEKDQLELHPLLG